MNRVSLHPTRCAICGTDGQAAEIYPANFDFADFNPEIFSARRLPDRIHYRMVKCSVCGLVRSDPVADAATLGDLYRQSTFDYGTEVDNLRRTYGRYLDRLGRFAVANSSRGRSPSRADMDGLSQKGGRASSRAADLGAVLNLGSLLEIGCGNGFFLDEARTRGYAEVRGVEPSCEAIAKAPSAVRDRIVCDIMRPGLFPGASFDAVCLFQVFDHLPDPAGVLAEAGRVLKPGGHLLILNHNIRALSARLLGERSPIVDLEHTFLFTPGTLSRLVRAHGLTVCETGRVWNRYTLQYVTRLVPLPAALKRGLLACFARTRIGRLPVWIPLGNLYLVARKPA